MSDEKPLHVRQAEGLRALADFVEAYPHLGKQLSYSLSNMSEPVYGENSAGRVAEFARAAAHSRVANVKSGSDKYFRLELKFSDAIVVSLATPRDEVCERVVVGTETVTKKVPDPELLAQVPEVEVTETVEQVEWRCRPLLAEDGAK